MIPPTNPAMIFWRWEREIRASLFSVLEDELRHVEFEQAHVGSGLNTKVNAEVRKSDLFFLHSHHWMAGVLANYATHANVNAGWDFTLLWPESLQVTRYGLNEFYDFHTDSAPVVMGPHARKVSVSCCMTPADAYEGGELEFDDGSVFKMDCGDIIVFPSMTRHRVRPVTAGERRSLVTWVLGPNIK